MEKRKYDSTVARIAGNVAGAMLDRVMVHSRGDETGQHSSGFSADTLILIAQESVMLARAIVAEVERTEPLTPPQPPTETP